MKQLVRNIAFSMVGFIVPTLVLFLTVPIIVKGLGEDAYGVQAIIVNVLSYLSLFNILQTAGTKYIAEYSALDDKTSLQNLMSTTFIFYAIVGIIGAAMIFVLSEPLVNFVFKIPMRIQTQSIFAFKLASIGFFASALSWWGGSVLSGVQRYDKIAIGSSLMITISSFGGVSAVWLDWGLIGVVFANVLASLFLMVFYTWSSLSLLSDTDWKWVFDIVIFKRIFKFGLFSMMQLVLGIASSQLDRTLLGVWIGMSAVTVYSIPLRVASKTHQLCAKALEVILPLSSELDAQKDTKRLGQLFLRAQNLNTVLAVSLVIPLWVLAPVILKFWIDTDFALRATGVFQILVLAYGILAIAVVVSAIASGLNHPEVNTVFAFFSAVIKIGGFIGLIRVIGPIGAGYANLLASTLTVLPFIFYVNWRFVGEPFGEVVTSAIVRPILPGIITGLALFFIRPLINDLLTLLMVIITSFGMYLILSVFTGVWNTKELELIKNMPLRIFLKLSH